MKVFDEKDINIIRNQYENGLEVKRKDRIFYQNMKNVRAPNIVYKFSHIELLEHARCLDINYFIDKYYKMKMYDFQKEALHHFRDNRFSINIKSRQTGIDRVLMLYFLHEITFNIDRSIKIFNNKSLISIEQLNIFKELYKSLPFFLQVGIKSWKQRQITFDNGGRVLADSSYRNPAIGSNYDIWYFNDFAEVPDTIIRNAYESVMPTISSLKNSKLIITSTPNGNNLFYDLVQDSYRGNNSFKTIKSYWWGIPGRDEKWKNEQIKLIGSKKMFSQDYDLNFF